MTASYIGIGTNKGGASSGAVVSHASTLAGDLLILLVHLGGATTISSITGGSSPTWTQFGTRQSTANAFTNLEVWYAKAAAGDIAATFTVTYGAAIQYTLGLATWRGGSGQTPSLGNFQGAIDNTAGTAITSPNWNGAIAVAFGGVNTFTGTPTCTVSGGSWTEIADQTQTSFNASDIANDTATSGSGNAGSTFTWTASGTSRAALTFNVIDAGGTPLFFGSN